MIDLSQVSTIEWIAAAITGTAVAIGLYVGARQARAFWTEAGDRSLITALLTLSPSILSQLFRGH